MNNKILFIENSPFGDVLEGVNKGKKGTGGTFFAWKMYTLVLKRMKLILAGLKIELLHVWFLDPFTKV